MRALTFRQAFDAYFCVKRQQLSNANGRFASAVRLADAEKGILADVGNTDFLQVLSLIAPNQSRASSRKRLHVIHERPIGEVTGVDRERDGQRSLQGGQLVGRRPAGHRRGDRSLYWAITMALPPNLEQLRNCLPSPITLFGFGYSLNRIDAA